MQLTGRSPSPSSRLLGEEGLRVTTIYEGSSEMQRLVIARHLMQR